MSWGVHGWMNATNSSQYCKTGDQIRVTSLPESNLINHSTRIKKMARKVCPCSFQFFKQNPIIFFFTFYPNIFQSCSLLFWIITAVNLSSCTYSLLCFDVCKAFYASLDFRPTLIISMLVKLVTTYKYFIMNFIIFLFSFIICLYT
jgi:hypothetical protein